MEETQNPQFFAAEPPSSHLSFPPTEISIRTMASDIQSLRESGGAINRPAEKIILQQENTPVAGSVVSPAGVTPSKNTKLILWLVGGIALIIILFLVGYLILPSLFPR